MFLFTVLSFEKMNMKLKGARVGTLKKDCPNEAVHLQKMGLKKLK